MANCKLALRYGRKYCDSRDRCNARATNGVVINLVAASGSFARNLCRRVPAYIYRLGGGQPVAAVTTAAHHVFKNTSGKAVLHIGAEYRGGGADYASNICARLAHDFG